MAIKGGQKMKKHKQKQEEILKDKIKELEKELRSSKANIIRDLKRNHPKGFCYICGKGKRTTNHHLREVTFRGKGRVTGEIPLCRDCHDAIECMKRFVKLKQAYKKGFEEGRKEENKKKKAVKR